MRKTDISCRRCGYAATVEGKPPERCPGCSVGTKPEAVLEFEQRLQQTMSQLMWEGVQGGWPIHKLKWRKYPNNEGRIDLMYELQRLAIIRCKFDGAPEITFRWVGPENCPLTAAESVLLGDLEKAKAAQDAEVKICPECGIGGMHDWRCSQAPAIKNVDPEGPTAA